MPSEHDRLLDLAYHLANDLAEDPNVETILLTGSVAQGHVDRHSDLDLMIGYRELPPPEDIDVLGEAAIASGGGIYGKDVEKGITLYRWIEGIKVDQGHGRVADVEALIEGFLAEPEVKADTQHIVFNGIGGGLPLHGAERIRAWKARIAEYPESYGEALVRAGLRFPPRAVLEGMGLERGDHALVWEMLLLALERAVQVLCGLNRRYPPGKLKGLAHSMAGLEVAPPGTPERLVAAMAAPAEEAVAALMAFHAELWDLVDAHMPQVDTAEARAFLDTPLRQAG